MIKDEDGNDIPDPDDQEEPEEDEELPPGEEWKEKNFDNYETDKTIVPSCFIWIDGKDEVLKQRVKTLPQNVVANTHWATEADMDRWLKAYREQNKSDVLNPCLTDFFSQYGISFFSQHCNDPVEKVFEAFKIFIEKGGKPFNYMTFDEQNEQSRLMSKD